MRWHEDAVPSPAAEHQEGRPAPIVNKTQQASLEDALLGRTRDEFLRNNRYPLVPESEAPAQTYVWDMLARDIVDVVTAGSAPR